MILGREEELQRLRRQLKSERKEAEREREAMMRKQKGLEEAEVCRSGENDGIVSSRVQAERRWKEVDSRVLHERLMLAMPLCREATLIAKEMARPYT